MARASAQGHHTRQVIAPERGFPSAGTTLPSHEVAECLPYTLLNCLNLVLVYLPPFLALGKDMLFRFLERFVNLLTLEEIAGLAGGHQVIHTPLAALGARMDVVDSQDQPAFEIVQPVETAVVALELISRENLHRIFATQVR
jgi:hypothetical protein